MINHAARVKTLRQAYSIYQKMRKTEKNGKFRMDKMGYGVRGEPPDA
jgi:hypothetical protein